ncbi:MAG TPA: energy transducer TonB [Rhodanobacteraceae bacterium]|nr:energy transducer TonB [Rhodanobacteraceae bacterium]
MTFRTPDPHAIRGAAAPSRLIALAVIVIVLAAGAWWFFGRTPGSPIIPGTAPAPTPNATTPATAEAPAAVSDELTVDQLYREARKAMNENRMATPAGNNALEFYLKIMAKQPDDSGAKDALRELFPFATGAAEDQINQGQFDEANRIIALLAQADPSNYSLTILRSKLDAKKKLADREQQQAQLAAAAAAKPQTPGTAATPTPEGATAATTPAPAGEGAAGTAPAAATPAAAETTASTATAPTPRPAAPPPPAPASAGGETREVAVTSPPVPVYPIAAARNRQEGWVEVEFTVAPDGSVQNAHVTGSQPSRIFDREAIAAVQRAKFQPRMENGTAVASTLRRRIEFKLGN